MEKVEHLHSSGPSPEPLRIKVIYAQLEQEFCSSKEV